MFLREIAKRLLVGLEPIIPDLQQRVDHIFHKQLFGIAITELTSLLGRRSVYCSKYPNSKYSVSCFEDVQGNIRFKNTQHVWRTANASFAARPSRNTALPNAAMGWKVTPTSLSTRPGRRKFLR